MIFSSTRFSFDQDEEASSRISPKPEAQDVESKPSVDAGVIQMDDNDDGDGDDDEEKEEDGDGTLASASTLSSLIEENPVVNILGLNVSGQYSPHLKMCLTFCVAQPATGQTNFIFSHGCEQQWTTRLAILRSWVKNYLGPRLFTSASSFFSYFSRMVGCPQSGLSKRCISAFVAKWMPGFGWCLMLRMGLKEYFSHHFSASGQQQRVPREEVGLQAAQRHLAFAHRLQVHRQDARTGSVTFKLSAAVVAQRLTSRLVIKRSWVWALRKKSERRKTERGKSDHQLSENTKNHNAKSPTT